jgi:hypothetical protein
VYPEEISDKIDFIIMKYLYNLPFDEIKLNEEFFSNFSKVNEILKVHIIRSLNRIAKTYLGLIPRGLQIYYHDFSGYFQQESITK